MPADVLAHFAALDELIQVIYQGFDRFVILSSIDDRQWTLHLALSGGEGKWWRGTFSANDILEIIGTDFTTEKLEALADNILGAFIQGSMSIGNLKSKNDQITLMFETSGKKTFSFPLIELSAKEGASHATAVLTQIALSAKCRQCQLNPSSSRSSALPESFSTTATNDRAAQQKIRTLEAEFGQAKQKTYIPPSEASSSTSAALTLPSVLLLTLTFAVAEPSVPASVFSRPVIGALLANPGKRARKYQALEFESDED